MLATSRNERRTGFVRASKLYIRIAISTFRLHFHYVSLTVVRQSWYFGPLERGFWAMEESDMKFGGVYLDLDISRLTHDWLGITGGLFDCLSSREGVVQLSNLT
jgi:hypothetical protein